MRKECICILCALCMFAGSASAITYPSIFIDYSDGQWQKTYDESDIQVIAPETYYLEDSVSNGVFDAEWNITFKSDPYVISYLSFQNTTGVSQTYTVKITQPVSPTIGPSSIYGGSVSGSLTTDPLGGYVSTVSPEPLYMGMIDNVNILSFYPHLSSWTRSNGGTTTIDLQEAWGLINGAVNTDISIQHIFELGANDAVALTGYFQVEVPEPATLLLLGIGAVMLKRCKKGNNPT